MYEEFSKIVNQITAASEEEAINDTYLYKKSKKILSAIETQRENNLSSMYKLPIFLNSFLYHCDKNPSNIISILKIILNNKEISHYTKFFYLYQVISLQFTNNNLSIKEINSLINNVYIEILEQFKKELNLSENHIPEKERNKDIIFVITSQFLVLTHAPTKTALDRALTFKEHFNKNILLINTADMLTYKKSAPFYCSAKGNIIKKYENINQLNNNDISIQFYQPKVPMPDIEEIEKIIKLVLEYKPYFIFNIGGTNITSDLCSLFVPTISQATVFSGLPLTEGTFSVTANPKLCTSNKTILTTFTFDYKPQTHKYTRDDFSLPNKFLIIVSGGRLTLEVTYEFLNDIREIFNYNAHIVFCGIFDTYEKIVSNDKVLRENTTFLGFQEDMLAISEICDLYINPPRKGGGSSIAEAFSKGKPGITLNFGDCSIAAGKDFCVKDLKEMKDTIIKYITDKEFYKEMSEKALKRNAVLRDTKKALNDIINYAENSKLWW